MKNSSKPNPDSGSGRRLDLLLITLCFVPLLLFWFLFPQSPFEMGQGFEFLRIGLVIVSFMLYMMTKYLVGFLKMSALPRLFRQALRISGVLSVLVVGSVAVAYGKWWLEFLPHALLAAYALWRVRV